jgi:UDP-N-acetyl-D-glucosamine dehydrogenase
MRAAIIGQGYVGLTISMGAVGAGHEVIGVDFSEALVGNLISGISHIEGISNADVAGALGRGLYRPTSDYSHLSDVDLVVIAVPTPLDDEGQPDLGILKGAAKSIGSSLKKRTLIVSESTSHPGTLRNLIRPIIESASPLDHMYAISPERVDPGNGKFGTRNTPRIVGGLSDEARDKAIQFYRSFCDEVMPASSAEVAEAAKILENTFRFINIGLVNEFTKIMNEMGIPSDEVIAAARTKPYGFMPFHPNVGIGGHCIPVDPMYLQAKARELGIESRYIALSEQINEEMPNYVVGRLTSMFGDLRGKRVQVFGVSYKADVADTRETPASSVIRILKSKGAVVTWHDPLVPLWDGVESSPVDQDSDLGLVLVAHKKLDLKDFGAPVFTINPNPNFPNWRPLLSVR